MRRREETLTLTLNRPLLLSVVCVPHIQNETAGSFSVVFFEFLRVSGFVVVRGIG